MNKLVLVLAVAAGLAAAGAHAQPSVNSTLLIDAMKARVAEAEGTAGEVAELRSERDQIRARVSEMLQQLDALNL